MSKVSKFVIKGINEVEISAGGMRDWESLTLQRTNNYKHPAEMPLQFRRVASVEGDKCLDFIELQWYKAIEFIESDSSQYEIKKWSPISNNPERSPVTQNFFSNVGQVAGNDIIINIENINTNVIFDTLIKSVEKSPEIPESDKSKIIDSIKIIASNPYVSGLSTSLIFEVLKNLMQR
ncbi:hypothetical protein QRD38_11455 [Leptospira weilii]|uniref:hypothetical protein n=1 Tax=Leptospira weilii TaxID=28184 RepID=UPI00256EDF9F|nr:hypothetical protein [Leptospira weilii]MDL5246392.1 hypothetical protein [Leptospira weilii]